MLKDKRRSDLLRQASVYLEGAKSSENAASEEATDHRARVVRMKAELKRKDSAIEGHVAQSKISKVGHARTTFY